MRCRCTIDSLQLPARVQARAALHHCPPARNLESLHEESPSIMNLPTPSSHQLTLTAARLHQARETKHHFHS